MAINLRRTDSSSHVGSIGQTETPRKTGKVDDGYGMTQTESTSARAGRGAGARSNPLTAIKDFFTKTIPNFFKSLFGGGQAPGATPQQAAGSSEGLARTQAMTKRERVDLSGYKDSHTLADAVLNNTDPKITAAAEYYVRNVAFAAENLDFLRAVQDYKAHPTPEKAQEIMDEFIGDRSQQNVNVYEDGVRTTNANIASGRFDGSEFDLAFGRARDNLADAMRAFEAYNKA
jgi:hypothetical protein